MKQIQNLIKKNFSVNKNEQGQKLQSYEQVGIIQIQIQCKLCMSEYNHINHPIKICINDHNMCQKCVTQKLFTENKIMIKGQIQVMYFCPYCEHLLQPDYFVINYKTLYLINLKLQKREDINIKDKDFNEIIDNFNKKTVIKSKNTLFQSLSEQSFTIIMQYLNQKDKIQITSTNIFLRSILMDGKYWGQFQISDCLSLNVNSHLYQKNWQSRLKWIQKYFTIIKPHKVKISIMNYYDQRKLVNLFLQNYPWIDQLSIYCESMELHLAFSKSCFNITSLVASSSVFSDQLFHQMCKSLQNIKKFQVIKDDSYFTGQNLSKYFPTGLQSLNLKPHLIDFEQISLLVRNNPSILREIQLDVEQCHQSTLIQIMQPLQNLEVIKLFHLQNIHIPEQLSKSLSNKVRQIYLTKAYEMSVNLIIQKIASSKLLTLDFTEIIMFDDQNLQQIYLNCPYLRKINISWCHKVSEKVVQKLVESCLFLQQINFTGLKFLTDSTFKQYEALLPYFDENKYDTKRHQIAKAKTHKLPTQNIEAKTQQFFKKKENNTRQDLLFKEKLQNIFRNIKTLRHIKQLVCISCNTISDKILKIIYLINRRSNVVNYYSSPLGLYAFDQIGDQIW